MKPRKITVEFLKSRCKCDGDDGCWIWKEAHVNGQPRMCANGKPSLVHRVMWELVKGHPPRHELYAKCGNKGCINPAHRVDIPRCEIPKRQTRDGRMARGKRISVLRSAEARKRSPLTLEMVRAIRQDTRKQDDIAAEYGIAQATVSSIKIGRTWREGILA